MCIESFWRRGKPTLRVVLSKSHGTSGVSEDLSRVGSKGDVDATEMFSPS